MADSADSVQSFFRKHWNGYKEFWGERFSILDSYSRYLETDPTWSEADIQEFIASDPVHGPTTRHNRVVVDPPLFVGEIANGIVMSHTNHNRVVVDPPLFVGGISNGIIMSPLKTCRDTAKIAAVGSVVGAFSTAAFSWKYSKSPHGAALSFGAGAVFGWTFGQEIASHWYQLYRKDPMAAQVKFVEWWDKKRQ